MTNKNKIDFGVANSITLIFGLIAIIIAVLAIWISLNTSQKATGLAAEPFKLQQQINQLKEHQDKQTLLLQQQITNIQHQLRILTHVISNKTPEPWQPATTRPEQVVKQIETKPREVAPRKLTPNEPTQPEFEKPKTNSPQPTVNAVVMQSNSPAPQLTSKQAQTITTNTIKTPTKAIAIEPVAPEKLLEIRPDQPRYSEQKNPIEITPNIKKPTVKAVLQQEIGAEKRLLSQKELLSQQRPVPQKKLAPQQQLSPKKFEPKQVPVRKTNNATTDKASKAVTNTPQTNIKAIPSSAYQVESSLVQGWVIYLFSTASQKSAEREVQLHRALNIDARYVRVISKGKVWFHVLISGFETAKKAIAYKKFLKDEHGIDTWYNKSAHKITQSTVTQTMAIDKITSTKQVKQAINRKTATKKPTQTALPTRPNTTTQHVFRFEAVDADVWLEVYAPNAENTGKGKSLKRRLLKAGQFSSIATSHDSLWITAGNAPALSISINGKITAQQGSLGAGKKVLRNHHLTIKNTDKSAH